MASTKPLAHAWMMPPLVFTKAIWEVHSSVSPLYLFQLAASVLAQQK
jgi:hypothetical protein